MADSDIGGNPSDAPADWSNHFEESIRAESIRAKVILSACYLEELSRQFVEILLKPAEAKADLLLDGANAPLASQSARIELLWRMGAIPNDTKRSLHYVRKIRNRFAHSLADCSFEDQQIRDWNTELHRLNDHATPETRATYSEGSVGDFEKSISWLVFLIRHLISEVPTGCPSCGSEMEHRFRIKRAKPGEHP